ncbi:MAG TPA: sulfite exporter TauE/SafE family protein [Terracidiphilus sp.]|nr:sulfite exporter TauE/SafE family protein [Terracidiphilus sp.]
MDYLVGFLIALFIALTGVGAGTVTVPILVLFLNVPAAIAVGIGLMFSAAVKLILVPAQIARRTIAWRTLGFMLLGGLPGVLIGSLFLKHLVTAGSQTTLNAILGAILVGTASWQLLFSFRPMKEDTTRPDRSPLLAWLMLPVGAEVGFSSAGAGALGSAALLSLTPLLPAQVVGTDIAFGFLVSLIGSGAHWSSHAADNTLLLHLIAGGVLGAIAGTMLSTHIPKRPLRLALWVWLLILGGQFLVNSYQAKSVQAAKQTAVHAERQHN